MKYWKEHRTLRAVLMLATFLLGIALMVYGWTLTGKLSGLGLMLVGVALLLVTLWLYNARFAEPRRRKGNH